MVYQQLEVIVGPMFSGKTAELVRRIQLAQIAHLRTTVFRPQLDTRTTEEVILSRNGTCMLACCVPSSADIYRASASNFDVVGIDEAQFFDNQLLDVVGELTSGGTRVIVAGLDLNFAVQPFGPIPQLLALADRVDKLTAVCCVCYNFSATRTQRLVRGKPAPIDGPQVVIDKFRQEEIGDTTYEARCAQCHQLGTSKTQHNGIEDI